MIRPTMSMSHGFSATWYEPTGGPKRRPATSEEARVGAAQEWSKLMKERPNKCSHPLITPYIDGYGRPRGTLNLHAACKAPPDSDVRRIANAYMGSPDSGYFIFYLFKFDTIPPLKYVKTQYNYETVPGR